MKNYWLPFVLSVFLSSVSAQGIPNLPLPLGAGTCEVWQGNLYHFGGSDDDIGTTLFQRIYKYDGNWSLYDSIPDDAMWGVESVLAGDVVYLLGGFPGLSFHFRGYNIGTGNWFVPNNSPNTIWTWGVTAEYLDGFIYLFLPDGYNFRYEIAEDTWTPIADCPSDGYNGMRSVLYQDEIFIIGYRFSRFYKYSPTTDQWTQLADTPYPVSACGMGIIDDKICCVGGDWYKSMIVYDITSNQWYVDGFELSDERYWMATAKYQGELYVLGGLDSINQAVNTVEKIVPQGPAEIKSQQITGIPKSFVLYQNYPNPFNPVTTIEFYLPKPGDVTLKVYNALGEEVVTIVSRGVRAGLHRYRWTPTVGIASGIYWYWIKAEGFSDTNRMLYLK